MLPAWAARLAQAPRGAGEQDHDDAALLVACRVELGVAIGGGAAAERWIEAPRRGYSRFPAFTGALGEALGRLKT